ncbi:hypothetical protein ACXWOO_11710, partial [Streptococcus pyogenes]
SGVEVFIYFGICKVELKRERFEEFVSVWDFVERGQGLFKKDIYFISFKNSDSKPKPVSNV